MWIINWLVDDQTIYVSAGEVQTTHHLQVLESTMQRQNVYAHKCARSHLMQHLYVCYVHMYGVCWTVFQHLNADCVLFWNQQLYEVWCRPCAINDGDTFQNVVVLWSEAMWNNHSIQSWINIKLSWACFITSLAMNMEGIEPNATSYLLLHDQLITRTQSL